MPPTIARFVQHIWRRQPENEHRTPTAYDEVHHTYGFLSVKDWSAGTWSDLPVDPTNPALPSTNKDVYFTPCLFADSRRLRKNALPGRWLYADLDAVDPRTLTPSPTIAWQTSPGRYQAMWLLDRPLSPRRLEELNRKLTYYTGADRGGWSLTKVLRVPGSVSTKYGTDHPVRLLKRTHDPIIHSVADLSRLLRDVDDGPDPASLAVSHKLPLRDLPAYPDVYRRTRKRMPPRARQLLNTRTILESDDRSARLWELENLLLHDAGLKPEDVFVLVRHSPWNKYDGQRREARALWAEIRKAMQSGPARPRNKKVNGHRHDPASPLLPNTLDWKAFMHREWPKPTWLVDRMWTKGAYGIFAGEYKAYKTTILLDLALSVASGKPFLGEYKVPDGSIGPVCYIHEEGRPWSVHDRMVKLAVRKGLWDQFDATTGTLSFNGHEPQIVFSSLPGLNLLDDSSQAALSSHIATIKPRLVILETLYLLAGGADENAQAEMSPILEYLARLSHEHDTALILSHHFHKSKDEKRLLDRMSGTGVFGRWYESALFAERIGAEEDNAVRLSANHRDGRASHMDIALNWDPEDDTSLTIERVDDDDDPADTSGPDDLATLLAGKRFITARAAAATLGVTRQTIVNWAKSDARFRTSEQTVNSRRQLTVSLSSKRPKE